MTKIKFASISIIIALLLFGMVNIARAAVPTLPSSFYGAVQFSDAAPGVGDIVEAFVPGVAGAAASSSIRDESGLVYSMNVPGDDSDTAPKDGGAENDVVTFKINGRTVAEGVWHSGTNVLLNFHPPQALPGGPYTGTVGSAVNFSGSATDLGSDTSQYEWDWNNDGTYDEVGQTPGHTWSDAGNYTVRLKVTDLQGGVGSATVGVTINPIAATVTLSNLSHTYDGSGKSATATTVPAGLSVAITYDGSATLPINANDYTTVATITDPNYSGSDTDTLTIAKASSTTTVSGGGSFVYNASAHAATVSVTGVGGLNLTPAPVYSGACSGAPINVADTPCTASYTFAGDANHNGSSDTTSITITKAAATVTLSNLSHTYDGSGKSATATTVPASLSVAITYDGSATLPINADDYTTVATITDPNYSGSDTDTLTIAKASSTTTVSGGGSFIYNGSPHSATVSVTGVGGLSLTPDPVYSCTTAPVNVADTPCTASYTFAGDTNHDGSTDSKIITITKATATVTLGSLSHVYDGLPKSATATTVPTSLSVGFTYNGSPTAPTSPGSYDVIATISDSNYQGSSSDTMVILAKHSVALVPGWNLVSFNVHPTSTAIADVLSTITGNFDLVYTWDASVSGGNWLKYDNIPASPDTLSVLDEMTGFWVHMTASDTLDVIGTLPTTSNIAIYDNAGGWNLVGYPSAADVLLPTVLSSHGVASFSLVYANHAADTSDPWKLFDDAGLPYANDLTQLSPGWGYWIKVSADQTWGVNY